ncbi:MAG: hypothetical protein ACHBN1_22130 [Heteroscytonema crispum UTEX LB 1556]
MDVVDNHEQPLNKFELADFEETELISQLGSLFVMTSVDVQSVP